MLKIIRRVFSFADWSRSHPGSPHPGDMLDAQFDEIIDKVDDWDARVRRAITEDGKIAYNAIDNQSVVPQIAEAVYHQARTRIEAQIHAVDRAAKMAKEAKDQAEAALIRASQLQAQAQILEDSLAPVTRAALDSVDSLLADAKAMLDQAKSAQDGWTNAEKDAFSADQNAMLWAEVSQDWAEHMPDTIPPNTLAAMGISGEHWSARWWANRADNAFGRLTDLYLGVWPAPPLANLEGGPIEIGSIYYDSDSGQMYVWTGAGWSPLWAPQRSVMATLTYNTTAGQTVQALTDSDINGENYTITAGQPEAIDIHLDGVRLVHTGSAAVGDYVIDNDTSTITFAQPLSAGGVLLIDVLMPEARMAGGQVQAWALNPITTFNGTLTTFTLTAKNPSISVNIQRSEELLVSLNDVLQEPGVDFTAALDQITFAVAPPASTPNFITWFQGMGTGSGGSVAWGDITGKPGTFPPSAHGHAQADITNLVADLALKAPLASPALTGTPTAPTPVVADSSTKLATTNFVTSYYSSKDAPNDGASYVRKNLAWALMPPVDLSGYLPLTGGTLTGNLTINKATPILVMQRAASSEGVRLDALDEAGVITFRTYLNAGTSKNFQITRYDAAGVGIGSPFVINWATGEVNFNSKVIVTNDGIDTSGYPITSGSLLPSGNITQSQWSSTSHVYHIYKNLNTYNEWAWRYNYSNRNLELVAYDSQAAGATIGTSISFRTADGMVSFPLGLSAGPTVNASIGLTTDGAAATSSPYLQFMQAGTRRMYLQYHDTEGAKLFNDVTDDSIRLSNTNSINALTFYDTSAAADQVVFHEGNSWYTGSSSSNTSYVIGSYLLVKASTGVNRNVADAIFLDTGDAKWFNNTGGTAVAGTWRSRGYTGGDTHLFQRTL